MFINQGYCKCYCAQVVDNHYNFVCVDSIPSILVQRKFCICIRICSSLCIYIHISCRSAQELCSFTLNPTYQNNKILVV
jgi:hypothetical protein